MIKPAVNKAKRLEKLANDIKELLQLDECEPVLLPGEAWLRMRAGQSSLDCPIGTKPLFDKKKDNTPAIKRAVISLWITHLEREQAKIAGAVLNG